MRKATFLLICISMLWSFTHDVNAQENKKKGKFGNVLKKVNKALEDTNMALDDVNSALKGEERNVTQKGKTKVISPKRNLQLDFKECYSEGEDVVVVFTMLKKDEGEQGFNWGNVSAWDEEGNEHKTDRVYLGGRAFGAGAGTSIPSSVTIKGEIRLKGVGSKVNSFKLLKMNTHQISGFEMRNIDINRDPEYIPGTETESDSVSVNSVAKFVSPTRNLKMEYQKCYAENDNTVMLEFTITNLTTEDIGLNSGGGEAVAWDDNGIAHNISQITFGGKELNSLGVTLPAEIPIKGTIAIKGISKNVKTLKLVKFSTYQFKGFNIKDVIINREEQEQ